MKQMTAKWKWNKKRGGWKVVWKKRKVKKIKYLKDNGVNNVSVINEDNQSG